MPTSPPLPTSPRSPTVRISETTSLVQRTPSASTTEAVAGPSFFLHRAPLLTLARQHQEAYRAAAPYPHLAFDGLFGPEIAEALASALPSPETRGFRRRDYKEQSARLGQLQRTGFVDLSPLLRHVLAELSSMAFLDFLGALTQHEGLIADPHFRGAGLSLTLPGGHLALHADFNRDRVRHLRRVVTVLYYLGRDWQEADGGALELWNDGLTACEASYLPVLDRLVVMEHGDRYWHGQPAKVTCPEGRFRAVLTAYFYVVDVNAALLEAEEAAHSAVWVEGNPDLATQPQRRTRQLSELKADLSDDHVPREPCVAVTLGRESQAMPSTVRVPQPFEPLFAEAERYVRASFEQLRRAPEQGTIHVGDERYVLVRAASLTTGFLSVMKDLIGEEEALKFWYQMARVIGAEDARAFCELRGLEDPAARLSTGPVHFAFAGWARVEIDDRSNPAGDSSFYLEYTHPNTFESEAWLRRGEKATRPVCAFSAGYSAGWCSEAFHLDVHAREVSCVAAGDPECRFVMSLWPALDGHEAAVRARAKGG
jgi:hypothetical protein